MKGRPRKPVDRAQGHRRRPALALVPTVAVGPHDAPDGLLPQIRDRWEDFWRSEFAQLINWDRDQDALRALYRLYDLRRRLELAADDVFTMGSQKQLILNPALKQLTIVDGAILAREQQFGLTPRSAAALGLSIGGLKKTLDDLNREANDRAYRPARKVKAAR